MTLCRSSNSSGSALQAGREAEPVLALNSLYPHLTSSNATQPQRSHDPAPTLVLPGMGFILSGYCKKGGQLVLGWAQMGEVHPLCVLHELLLYATWWGTAHLNSIRLNIINFRFCKLFGNNVGEWGGGRGSRLVVCCWGSSGNEFHHKLKVLRVAIGQ